MRIIELVDHAGCIQSLSLSLHHLRTALKEALYSILTLRAVGIDRAPAVPALNQKISSLSQATIFGAG